MVGWIAIFCLIVVALGAPVDDESRKNVTETNAEVTTLSSITNDVEAFESDDEVPPPEAKGSSRGVIFLDVPEHVQTELGSSVLLPCRTVDPVVECQWSWQPLAPTHLPLPDTGDHPMSSMNVSSGLMTDVIKIAPVPQPLPVRSFPAFGNNSNDCSVRFSSIKHEQIGFWACAARSTFNDVFTPTEPAKLSISDPKNDMVVKFAKSESPIETTAGSSVQIPCRTEVPVQECQWSWRQFNQSENRNLEIKSFPAFGSDKNNCSIQFQNFLVEQEGLWTCGARINDSFVQSSPVKLLTSEVEFVQLSRGIQIAAGESAFLRCLVNKPVVQCEWSWRPTNTSGVGKVLQKFHPNPEAEHDCSVRFKNVLHEDEGLWTCGIRLSRNGILHEAPPATVTLLPSAKVNFVEGPENISAKIGTSVTLKCVMSERVEKCAWLWRPLIGNSESTIVKEFSSKGDSGRNCSFNIPGVTMEDQGFWTCQPSAPSLNTILKSTVAKLTVYEQDAVKFSELSKDIQISSGGSVLLRCVTTSAVEQCRWSLTPLQSNTTVVVKQFSAAGDEARDCSVRLSHALAEQEGLWTCGAKVHGQGNYTDAPSAKLSLLEPEPIAVAIWSHPHQKVTLGCKFNSLPSDADCHWIHTPEVRKQQNDTMKNERRNIQLNISTGICTIQLNPSPSDLGSWICKFTLNTETGYVDLGNSSIVLFNTQVESSMLGWIVGSVTSIILLSMILAVTIVVCRGRLFLPKTLPILETASASAKNSNSDGSQHCQSAFPSAGVMETLNPIIQYKDHKM